MRTSSTDPWTSNLGEKQGLLAFDLIGYGREPLPPTNDIADNDGNVAVPLNVRNFGTWPKLVFGASGFYAIIMWMVCASHNLNIAIATL